MHNNIIYNFFSNLYLIKKLDTSIDYNLQDHGFAIYKNILSNDNIEDIKLQIKNDKYKDTKQYIMQLNKFNNIIKSIGNDYIFQDYIWIIKKSSVHYKKKLCFFL